MELAHLFIIAVRGRASDVIVKEGLIPKFRRNGYLVSIKNSSVISKEIMQSWVEQMLPPYLKDIYNEQGDVDFGYEDQVGMRFRINLFRQSGMQSFVARVIDSYIRSVEELQLPDVINKIPFYQGGGLVFFTGSTGSGKSTSMAAVIQKVNTSLPYHIITIEDPIEYVFTEDKSIISQREVGIDTKSYNSGLRACLRQSPNIIVLGELRDLDTVKAALMAAETGILVISTLHTKDVVQTLYRILNFFPKSEHIGISDVLSRVLRLVSSQRLIPAKDNKSLIIVTEIMILTERIKEIISKGQNFHSLKRIIHDSSINHPMHTFDQSLAKLYRQGKITKKTAFEHANSPVDLNIELGVLSDDGDDLRTKTPKAS